MTEKPTKEKIKEILNSDDWSEIEVSSNIEQSNINLKVMLKGTDKGIELSMSIVDFFGFHQMEKVQEPFVLMKERMCNTHEKENAI